MKPVEACFDPPCYDGIALPINWDFIGTVDLPNDDPDPEWIRVGNTIYRKENK